MTLTIDLGNSSVEFCIWENNYIKHKFRLVTEKSKSKDQYKGPLLEILKVNGIMNLNIKRAILCSVVPELNNGISWLVKDVFGIMPEVVRPGLKTGLMIQMDHISRVGNDLIVSAVGAMTFGVDSFIIVDLGTATTFSIVENSKYIGSVISPGLRVSSNSLIDSASLLVGFELDKPKTYIPKNTNDSLIAGVVGGHAMMIDGVIRKIQNELSKKLTVYITGGLANLVVSSLDSDYHVERNVIHIGMIELLRRNP